MPSAACRVWPGRAVHHPGGGGGGRGCAAAAAPQLTTRQKHQRHCYVVLAEGAEAEAVRQAIVTMPHYFDEYDTTVNFISAEELAREHSAMPHGGFVIRSGQHQCRHQPGGGIPPAAG